MRWPWRRRTLVLDPIGWDEAAQRVHDVEVLRDGVLLHYSTCWCRRRNEGAER